MARIYKPLNRLKAEPETPPVSESKILDPIIGPALGWLRDRLAQKKPSPVIEKIQEIITPRHELKETPESRKLREHITLAERKRAIFGEPEKAPFISAKQTKDIKPPSVGEFEDWSSITKILENLSLKKALERIVEARKLTKYYNTLVKERKLTTAEKNAAAFAAITPLLEATDWIPFGTLKKIGKNVIVKNLAPKVQEILKARGVVEPVIEKTKLGKILIEEAVEKVGKKADTIATQALPALPKLPKITTPEIKAPVIFKELELLPKEPERITKNYWAEFKKEFGLIKDTDEVKIITPTKTEVPISLKTFKHITTREPERRGFIKYIKSTLKEPLEVWKDIKGNETYLKIFKNKIRGHAVFVKISPEGNILKTSHPIERVNKFLAKRKGELIYSSPLAHTLNISQRERLIQIFKDISLPESFKPTISQPEKIVKSKLPKRSPTPARLLGEPKPEKVIRTQSAYLKAKLRTEARGARVAAKMERKIGEKRLKEAFKVPAKVSKIEKRIARGQVSTTRKVERGKATETMKQEKAKQFLATLKRDIIEGIGKKKIQIRRIKLKAIQDYYELTDTELRQISQQDFRRMDRYEFKKFLENIDKKAVLVAEKSQAKNELMDLIRQKEFAKWENMQKAMKLPTINNMTTDQLKTFAKAIEPYQFGDEFLSLRKLETIENTDLKGIKTIREAKVKLANEINIPISELDNLKVSWFDKFRWDTALAEKNPFYKLLVEGTSKSFMEQEQAYLIFERQLNNLARKALKSRKRTLIERLIPQQKRLKSYLEAKIKDKADIASKMTKEELNLVNFVQSSYEDAFGYLLKVESLQGSRFNNQDYFAHMRRGILETVKDDDVMTAFRELFKKYKEDAQIFNILDEKTDKILPLNKFFKFSVFRSGQLEPSKNVINVSRTYFKTFYRKKALDSVLSKMDIYSHILTPKTYTKTGLEMDTRLKRFVTEWLNNKKGRRTDFLKIPQGSTPDLALRGIKMFTSLMDLGLNIGVGVATYVGEKATTYTLIGKKKYLLGSYRKRTAKGKQIIKDNEAFVGRSAWSELIDPSMDIGDRLLRGLFVQFNDAATKANRTFLLGSLSKKEWATGKLSTERLAELRTMVGRYRVVENAKSIIGSTSAGGIGTQYKTWAIPIFRTMFQNLVALGKTITTGKKRITNQQLKEFYNTLEVGAIVSLVGVYALDKNDKSFIGQLKNRAYREAMTVYGALNLTTLTSVPRTVNFITTLAKNIQMIIELEKYKTREGLKGVEGIKKQLTPRAIKQFETFKKKETTKKKSKRTYRPLNR